MTKKPQLTLTYTLATADALAWERLPRQRTTLQFIGLLAWVGSVGGLAGLLPQSLIGAELSPGFFVATAVFGAAAWGIAILAQRVAGELRARRRVKGAEQVKLVQWPDRLEVERNGVAQTIAYTAISAVTPGPQHLFIASGGDLVIVPERAFRSRDRMLAFGKDVDRLSHRSAG